MVYQGLDVGSAKPSISERKEVPHHLIDILHPAEDYSAGNFYDDGKQAAKDILNRGRVPIVTGGTGLYLRWFIYGKPDVPKATAEISLEVQSELATFERRYDWDAAVELVMKAGDSSAQSLPANDWYRLRRKLEIIKGQVDSHSTDLGIATSTGAIVEERQKDLDYDFVCFFLSTSRTDLYRSIDLRCEDMISDYSAGNFYDDGRQAAKDILNRGRVLIVTGGTGLYLRWFIYGKPDVSKATAKISDSSAQSLPANDWYRLHRKLETIKSSGLPPSVFPVPYDSFKGQVDSHSTELGIATSTGAIVEEKQKDLDYNFICFFLSTSRMDLYRSIDLWCEDMISGDKGILSEARWLFDMGLLPNSNSATRAIGYRQAMEYLLNCEAQGGRSSTRNFYAFLSEFQKASRNFAKQTVDIVS
nr:tRNA dimethylallyltransferase 9 [Tanacetum cinerariifolium]